MAQRLAGQPDHDPAAHLVAEVLEVRHAAKPGVQRPTGVQGSVQLPCPTTRSSGGSVSACLAPQRVVFARPLSHRQRHGHVVPRA